MTFGYKWVKTRLLGKKVFVTTDYSAYGIKKGDEFTVVDVQENGNVSLQQSVDGMIYNISASNISWH